MNDRATPSPSNDGHPATSNAPPGTDSPPQPWRPLTRFERIVLAAAMLVLIATALPRLAPGICRGDPGDMQVACATLGIMHPPGYLGYAAAGWVVCKLFFFVDPAYIVTLACFASMVGALALLAVLQVRLGLHVLIAASLAMALTLFQQTWLSMTVPEIYAPSLLLLAASIYLFVKYERLGRRRDLYTAAGLFGFLAINRPPALMYAAAFVMALIVLEYRSGKRGWPLLRPVGMTTLCALAPMVATVAMYMALDVPTTQYNYITQYLAGTGEIPGASTHLSTDLGERWARVRWEMTGQQFRGTFGTTLVQAKSKLLWLRQRFDLEEPMACALTLCLLAIGTARLVRMSAAGAMLAMWVCLSVVAYVIVYRIYGQAADLLPLLVAGSLMVGAALSVLFPARSRRVTLVAALCFAGAAGWTGYHATVRASEVEKYDIRQMLVDVDLSAVAPGAAIVGNFDVLRPLWYARCVTHPRDDLSLVTLMTRDPIPEWLARSGAPIYSLQYDGEGYGQSAGLIRSGPGGKWRLVPYHAATGDARSTETN